MKFKIATLLLIILGLSVALAIWRVNHEHREMWQGFAEQSLPKSKWLSFSCLAKLDPDFVDFRSWRNDASDGACWAIWRTPSSSTRLKEHLEEFELAKCPLSDEMTVYLFQNTPKDWLNEHNTPLDWVNEHNTEFEVYQPKLQAESWPIPQLDPKMPLGRSFEERLYTPEIPIHCEFLLHDIENDILYVYIMTTLVQR